jgi:hypothetical protein
LAKAGFGCAGKGRLFFAGLGLGAVLPLVALLFSSIFAKILFLTLFLDVKLIPLGALDPLLACSLLVFVFSTSKLPLGLALTLLDPFVVTPALGAKVDFSIEVLGV